MDYTNDTDSGAGGASSSDPSNMSPNAHDYALINSKHNPALGHQTSMLLL
jgi:hypothetical protein